MPGSELLELAKRGTYGEFETRCLAALESGQLSLDQLVGPFEQLERAGQADRLAPLAQMVFENVDPATAPAAALTLARIALIADPKNEDLRRLTVEFYRKVYGHYIRFNAVLDASGLEGGRPVRMALKLLDLCLSLQPGDALISRMDDRVVEVTEIDREHGLFTLRREGRITTRPAPEVVREYDRIAPDDFRVLRQSRPEQLAALIEEDPVAVVIGLIHAHGEMIDADQLKHELVPKYIEPAQWSRWWTRARSQLKRCANVVVEGRSPFILSYSAEARRLEDQTWETFAAQRQPADWMSTVEGYLREKASHKEKPDEGLLRKFYDYLVEKVASARARRPAEAVACALVISRLGEKGLPVTEETSTLAESILREADNPVVLMENIQPESLRERGLQALQTARPDDWMRHAVTWLPKASAGLLDKLVHGALQAGHAQAVQTFIDTGLSDPASHPELIYWLWKGSQKLTGLNMLPDSELFRLILDTLSTLGRSVAAEPDVVKEFRQRTRAVLALRSYQRVRSCLEQSSEAAAITIRRQLQRLEGVGYTVQARLLQILQEVHPQLWVVKTERVALWDDPETLWTTAEGIARRTAMQDEIVNVKMRENAKRIGEAASLGDLSENSEYKSALEERDLLRARLARINDELSRAQPLEPHHIPNDHVGIGTRITLRSTADGSERIVAVLGPFDSDVENDVYSYLAPLARELLGHRVGDRVNFSVSGQGAEFEIIALASCLAGGSPA